MSTKLQKSQGRWQIFQQSSGVFQFFQFSLIYAGPEWQKLFSSMGSVAQHMAGTVLQANQGSPQLSFINGSCYMLLGHQLLLHQTPHPESRVVMPKE